MAITVLRESSLAMLAAPSPLGYLAVAVHGGELTGIAIGRRSAAAALRVAARQAACDDFGDAPARSLAEDEQLAADVLDRVVRYAQEEPVDFSDIAVAEGGRSAFQWRVVRACRAIGRGQRCTYGELAAAAGSPGAARAVGRVMSANRTPIVVPCHRVIAAGGKLGGFSAPEGLALKRRLLKMEADAGSYLAWQEAACQ